MHSDDPDRPIIPSLGIPHRLNTTLTQPYEPPEPTDDTPSGDVAGSAIPGRNAIWTIAGISFCFGAASLVGTWLFWRMPEQLAGLTGAVYYYYALRPMAFAIAFLGLSWKCFRYVDAITHHAIDSQEVRDAHGRVWNWMAAMLAVFVMMVVYHSLGG